jgi:hypothetical protein
MVRRALPSRRPYVLISLLAIALLPSATRGSLLPAWQQTWSTTLVTGSGIPLAVREISDGSMLLVSSGVATRYDTNGSVLSTAVFRAPFFIPEAYVYLSTLVPASAVAIGETGTIFVASCSDKSSSRSLGDVWLTAYDGSTGESLWPRPAIFDGPAHVKDIPTQILVGPDGNPIIVGHEGLGGSERTFILKFDRTSGAVLWGPVMVFENLSVLAAVDGSGNVIVAGADRPTGNLEAMEFFRIRGDDGSFAWGPVRYGDGSSEQHALEAVCAGPDGDFFVAASGPSGHELFRYGGATGDLIWGPAADGDVDSFFAGVTVTATGNPVLSTTGSGHFTLTEFAGASGSIVWGPVTQGSFTAGPGPVVVEAAANGDIVVSASVSLPAELDTWRYAGATGNLVWGPKGVNSVSTGHAPPMKIRSDGRIFIATSISQDVVAFERDPSSGDLVWGPIGYTATVTASDQLEDVCQGPDGSVFVTGYTSLPSGGYRWVTLKYDRASGAILWGPVYYDSGGLYTFPWNVRTDSAGNALVVGYDPKSSGLVVLKYAAADGALLWKSAPINATTPTQLAIDEAGDLAVIGFATSGAQYEFSTTKISGADGTNLWGPVLYARSVDRSAFVIRIAATPEGDFVVSGYSPGNGTYSEWITIKYSGSDGSVVWGPSLLGNEQISPLYVQDVVVGGDGGVIVVGSAIVDLQLRMATVKYSGATGVEIWGPAIAANSGPYDEAVQAATDSHSDVFVTGYMYNGGSLDFGTIKYRGADGAVLWGPRLFDGPAGGNDRAYAIALDGAGNPIVAGTSVNAFGTRDIVLVEYDGATGAPIGAPATLDGWQDHNLPFHNLVAAGTSIVVAGDGESFLTAAYQESPSIFCDPGTPPPVALVVGPVVGPVAGPVVGAAGPVVGAAVCALVAAPCMVTTSFTMSSN